MKNPLGKKTLALCFGIVALFSVALYTPPQTSRADPLLLGGILGGVLGIDFFSCSFNLIFYCDNGNNVVGADNGVGQAVQAPCTSSANMCGQTNSGFYGSDGVTCSAVVPADSSCTPCNTGANSCGLTGSGYYLSDGTTCNATMPADSSCAIPSIPAGTGFYTSPSKIQSGSRVMLLWNTTNSTSCVVTGGGLNQSGGPSGSVQTGIITAPTVFTLTCNNGLISQNSASITVHLIPVYKEL